MQINAKARVMQSFAEFFSAYLYITLLLCVKKRRRKTKYA